MGSGCRFLYCLSCAGDSPYADMTYISARSVRRAHPSGKIILLCDEETHDALRRCRGRVLDVADEVIAIDAANLRPECRSRFLKSGMRCFVPGSFLFLDADTIVLDCVDELFAWRCDVALAHDRNQIYPRPHVPTEFDCLCETLGWRFSKDYMNSGVILFRDTPGAEALGREWHRRWRLSAAQGVIVDQPALNSAIAEVRPDMAILDPRYNAMIHADARLGRDARILHFFMSQAPGDERVVSLMDVLLERLELAGEFGEGEILSARQRRYYWVGRPSAKRLWGSGRRIAACLWFVWRLVEICFGKRENRYGRSRVRARLSSSASSSSRVDADA